MAKLRKVLCISLKVEKVCRKKENAFGFAELKLI